MMTSNQFYISHFIAPLEADFLRVSGRDRVALLHRLSSADLRPLASHKDGVSKSIGTLFTNAQGRLLDWVHVVATPDTLFLHASKGRAAQLKAWIDQYTVMDDVKVEDVSNDYQAVLIEAMQDKNQKAIFFDEGLLGTVCAIESSEHQTFKKKLIQDGSKEVSAAFLEARRITLGIPSPMHEFKEEVQPLELRLGNVAVSWKKGCYVGQEVLARMDAYDKLARVLMGFISHDIIHEEGEFKLSQNEAPIGRVTSMAHTPDGNTRGLAIIKRDLAVPHKAITITSASGKKYTGFLVDCAFWQSLAS